MKDNHHEPTEDKLTAETAPTTLVEGQDDFDPRLLEVIRAEARYAIVQSDLHSGPMPSPRQLAEYDKVIPGLGAEIRDEFLNNRKHVRDMEAKALDYAKSDNDANRKVAERLVWGSLIVSAILALAGHDWVAGIMAASTVGAVITGFLNKRAKEKQKEQDNNGE